MFDPSLFRFFSGLSTGLLSMFAIGDAVCHRTCETRMNLSRFVPFDCLFHVTGLFLLDLFSFVSLNMSRWTADVNVFRGEMETNDCLFFSRSKLQRRFRFLLFALLQQPIDGFPEFLCFCFLILVFEFFSLSLALFRSFFTHMMMTKHFIRWKSADTCLFAKFKR